MQTRLMEKTWGQLRALAFPKDAQQPEAIPAVLYSTKSYVSGTTMRLKFFDTTEADETLSNVSGGQLPEPNFFEIHWAGCDFLLDVSSTVEGITGAISDVAKLLFVGRGTWKLSRSGKPFPKIPLSFFHASGGPVGFGWGVDMVAAGGTPTQTQYANNGIFDGGFHIGGKYLLPPKTNFDVEVEWAAAQTLAAGNTNIRVWLAGVLFRQVL